jgi:hypothetical protein
MPGQEGRAAVTPFNDAAGLVLGKQMTNEPVSWKETRDTLASSIRGIRDSITGTWALVKAGGESGAPNFEARPSPLGQIEDIYVKGIPVFPAGTMTRIPSRSIAAIHSFFTLGNFSTDKMGLAYRIADEEGLVGEARAARAGQIYVDPDGAAPGHNVMERAREGATERTLMGAGGQFMKRLSALINTPIGGVRYLKFIDPFVHIAGNVINEAVIKRMPLGLLSPELRADLLGREIPGSGTLDAAGKEIPGTGKIDYAARDMARARMIVGSAMGITFAGLAAEGIITGSGPKDRNENTMWQMGVGPPHSVRIGDVFYDVHRMGPLGMLLSMSADMYEVAHLISNGDLNDGAARLQHAITQNILDESFMRGPAELIEAVEDSDRYGPRYVRNILSSFVPFDVALSQAERASDPYTREARTVIDAIRAKIPGNLDSLFGQGLFPRIDRWGQPIPNKEALIHAGITSIYETKANTDPVNREMVALGIAPAPVKRTIRNVELTDQEYDDYARIAGRLTKMNLDALITDNAATWNRFSPYEKQMAVGQILKMNRDVAENQVMRKYQHIIQDALQTKADSFSATPEALRD